MQLIVEAPVVRLRTRVHPAAHGLLDIVSYDHWYEEATSFDELYERIVNDLVKLAQSSPNNEVLYAVPGAATVAERTVVMLRDSKEVAVIVEPAVSVLDVACAALGVDPMAIGLRVIDALESTEPLRGPGPLLILQTYSSEILFVTSERVPPATRVRVLHHLGLADQAIIEMNASELVNFTSVDHLTSLWIEELRSAGEAMDDLVSVTRRLRAQCPWDQEQTHASLTRHLLEESYEALDALENFVSAQARGDASDEHVAHVREELGDLLFQIVFHAELGDEEELFSLTTIADTLREKLIYRHPHVFADVEVANADDVAERWEVLKQKEKKRDSVTDGVAMQLPALSLYTKLLAKEKLLEPREDNRADLKKVLENLNALGGSGSDKDVHATSEDTSAWANVMTSLVRVAQSIGIDLEGILRESAVSLRDEIRARELHTGE
jgi:tetrapyrrole methylase family protein/MazG family protein